MIDNTYGSRPQRTGHSTQVSANQNVQETHPSQSATPYKAKTGEENRKSVVTSGRKNERERERVGGGRQTDRERVGVVADRQTERGREREWGGGRQTERERERVGGDGGADRQREREWGEADKQTQRESGGRQTNRQRERVSGWQTERESG